MDWVCCCCCCDCAVEDGAVVAPLRLEYVDTGIGVGVDHAAP